MSMRVTIVSSEHPTDRFFRSSFRSHGPLVAGNEIEIISENYHEDRELIRVNWHGRTGPEIAICHSSLFGSDLRRMLYFVLSTRDHAPWIMFVLAVSKAEYDQIQSFPQYLREHLSKYLRLIGDTFTIDIALQYIRDNSQTLGEICVHRREQFFGTKEKPTIEDIVSYMRPKYLEWEEYRNSDVRRSIHFTFAISFAGAQRIEARQISDELKARYCEVFFDEFETSSLLGRNLSEELYEVYAYQARYCIILASDEYLAGPWTNHERRAAIDRAMEERDKPYIIIVKFGKVDLPGISRSIAYLNWEGSGVKIANTLFEFLLEKLI